MTLDPTPTGPHPTPFRVASAARTAEAEGRPLAQVLRITPATRAERRRRQRTILDLANSGWPAEDIAREVGVSERTVYRELAASRSACTCPRCGTSHGVEERT